MEVEEGKEVKDLTLVAVVALRKIWVD